MKLARIILWAVGLALLALFSLEARCWNSSQIFIGGQTYFVDADCYARMTRVEQVMAAPWKPIRFHAFENAPLGTTPHTTAPLDFLIAGLAEALHPFAGMNALDLAGALVSPLLGVLLVLFLGWWARRLPFGLALLLVVSFSPIVVHGFLLGRPDHQSLILLLVGAAWAAELEIWLRPSPGWYLFSAVVWALGLWTSLYEPLILLIVTLLLRLFVVGRSGFRDRRAWFVFGGILLAALLFDGWRAQEITRTEAAIFFRWAQNIGELGHTPVAQLFAWTSWLLAIVPILLLYRFAKEKNRVCAALAVLLLLLVGLSLWQLRWGYFAALAFAFCLPWALAAIRWRFLAWALFLISLWPLAGEWDHQLFPDENRQAALAEQRDEAVRLRETATALISPTPSIILAPWWLSPALAYWSGQHCVGGSSHQSLPGIVDSARLYLSPDPAEAKEILKRRQVNYIVAYEPSRLVTNSAQILGVPVPSASLGEILYDHPDQAPDFLRCVYKNAYFKVYEFTGL